HDERLHDGLRTPSILLRKRGRPTTPGGLFVGRSRPGPHTEPNLHDFPTSQDGRPTLTPYLREQGVIRQTQTRCPAPPVSATRALATRPRLLNSTVLGQDRLGAEFHQFHGRPVAS